MTTARRRLLGIMLATVVLLGVAAALVVPRLIDVNRLLDEALRRGEAASGYALSAGGAEMRWGWRGLAVRVRDLEAHAPDASQDLAVGAVDLRLRFGPLLRRRVELSGADLDGVTLVQRAAPRGAPDGDGAAASTSPAASPALAVLAVDRWTLKNGSYRRIGEADTLDLSGIRAEGTFRFDPARGGELDGRAEVEGGGWSGLGMRLPIPATTGAWRAEVAPDFRSVTLPSVEAAAGPARLLLAGAYREEGGAWGGSLSGSMDEAPWSAVRPLVPEDRRAALAPLGDSGFLALPELTIDTDAASGETRTSGRATFRDWRVSVPGAPPIETLRGDVRFTAPGPLALAADGAAAGEPLHLELETTPQATPALDLRVRGSMGSALLAPYLPPPARIDAGRWAFDIAVRGAPPFDLEHLPAISGTVNADGVAGAAGTVALADGVVRLRLAGGGAELVEARALLDGDPLSVHGSVENLGDPFLRFALTARRIDLDALAAAAKPPAGGGTAAAPGAGPPAVTGTPAASAGSPAFTLVVPGEGTLSIDELRTGGRTLRDVRARLRLDEDGVRADLDRATLYAGTLSGGGTARYDAAAGTWAWNGAATMGGVRVPELLAGTPLGARLEGLLAGSLRAAGAWAPGRPPWRGLNADAALDVTDGAFRNVPALLDLASTLGLRAANDERWPFRELAARIRVEDGAVVFDSLTVRQLGARWGIQGRIAPDGAMTARGTVRLDAARVTLPPALQPLAAYVKDPNGEIPVDFTVGGRLPEPTVALDWEALGRRAAEGARRGQEDALRDALERAVPDSSGVLDRLKGIFGKKKGGG